MSNHIKSTNKDYSKNQRVDIDTIKLRKLTQHAASYIRQAKCKIAIAVLYLKHKVLRNRASLDYLKPLDAVLFQGGYSFIIWKCSGIYKIEIVGWGTLPGNARKHFLPLTSTTSSVTLIFYGADTVIHRTLHLNTTALWLKDQAVTCGVLNRDASYHDALLPDSPADILKTDVFKDTLKRRAEIHNLGVELEVTDFNIMLPEFKLSNYQN